MRNVIFPPTEDLCEYTLLDIYAFSAVRGKGFSFFMCSFKFICGGEYFAKRENFRTKKGSRCQFI